MEITKAIIPIAGLGTRFLPLSKIVPKELFPLGEKPLLQYAIEEAKLSGVTDIIFIVGQNKKLVSDYFKKSPKLEKVLEDQGKTDIVAQLQEVEQLISGLSFTYVTQAKPLGDGHAILQAKRYIDKDEACFVLYPDDVIVGDVPACFQLAQVFRTSGRPIMGLFRMPEDMLSAYGVVSGEQISRRLYQIKNVVEKPAAGDAPSNLAVVGRRIITAETFDYLKKTKPNSNGEVTLTEALGEMVKSGKMVYGHEIDGRWLECGNQKGWLKASTYIALTHPTFGSDIQRFIKKERLSK